MAVGVTQRSYLPTQTYSVSASGVNPQAAVGYSYQYVRTIGGGVSVLQQVVAIAVNPLTGNIYHIDGTRVAVVVTDPTGQYLFKWGSYGYLSGQFVYPSGIAVNGSGYVYVTDIQGMQVFTASGQFVARLNPSQDYRDCTIAINSTGCVFMADYDNNQVQVYSPVGQLLYTMGTVGSLPGQFSEPAGITVNKTDYVYVADKLNDRVQVFTPGGLFLNTFGTSGNGVGQFDGPVGVATNNSGYAYVTEYNNNRVQVFTPWNQSVNMWGTAGINNGQFNNPAEIAVNSSGNVFVADPNNYRVQAFNQTGQFLTKWGAQCDGYCATISGIAFNATGCMYLTDSALHRVQVFDPNGVFLTQWGTKGSSNGQFNTPLGIAVNSSGYVYVADSQNNRVQLFNSSGQYVKQWGSWGSNPGQFEFTWGIAVNSSGYVYVMDRANTRVQVFTSGGTYQSKWGSPTISGGTFDTNPNSIAIDPSNNIYVTDDQWVQKFTQTGTYLTEFAVGSGNPQDRGVAIDNNTGQIYVVNCDPSLFPMNAQAFGFSSALQPIATWGTIGTQEGQFNNPNPMAVNASGDVFVGDVGGVLVFQKIVTYPPLTPNLRSVAPISGYDSKVSVNWDAVNNATSYTAYRDNSSISTISGSVQSIGTVAGLNYTDTLSASGTYYYAVVASNAGGDSGVSNCISITVTISESNKSGPGGIAGSDFLWLSLVALIGVVLVVSRINARKISREPPIWRCL